MNTKRDHTKTTRPRLFAAALAAFAVIALGATGPAGAGRVTMVGNTNPDISVWVDDTWDVYPSYDDVVISVRAARGCYATVYLVDTEGFVHVIYPFSPQDDGWIEAGVTYRYVGRDVGLGALAGRGIAFVFAVGSPYGLDFAAYGDGLFVGRFGYRVLGDPFVAGRLLYVSLLPPSCRWDLVGVGFARFYVGEWARYPRYLCLGHHGPAVQVRAGNYCRGCYRVYDEYMAHANDPYRVLGPTSPYKTVLAERTRIKRLPQAYKVQAQDRSRTTVSGSGKTYVRPENRAKIVSAKRTNRTKAVVGQSRTSSTARVKVASGNYARSPVGRAKAGASKSKTAVKGNVSSGKTRSGGNKAGASR